MLIQGSLRSTLDPYNQFNDSNIWNALGKVGMDNYFKNMAEKLDANIEASGTNLSVGQRQLLFLARAILAKPKILVMDEATAALDSESDTRMQEALETEFKSTTVISIAHRLNTVAKFDKILVLEGGCLKEYDSPSVLINQDGSLFKSMVEAMGKESSNKIRALIGLKDATKIEY
jgi:ABC-type multidrug transport system fused ATPase/permease subunit